MLRGNPTWSLELCTKKSHNPVSSFAPMVHLTTLQSKAHKCTQHFFGHCTVWCLFSMPVKKKSETWGEKRQVLWQCTTTQFKHLFHITQIPTARWTIISLPIYAPTYLPTYPPAHLPSYLLIHSTTYPQPNKPNKSMQQSYSFGNKCIYSKNSSHCKKPKCTLPPHHIILLNPLYHPFSIPKHPQHPVLEHSVAAWATRPICNCSDAATTTRWLSSNISFS